MSIIIIIIIIINNGYRRPEACDRAQQGFTVTITKFFTDIRPITITKFFAERDICSFRLPRNIMSIAFKISIFVKYTENVPTK